MQETRFDLGVGMMPWRREWSPVFLLGEFRGQRSLAGYSPWDLKEWDTTEQVTLSLSNHSPEIPLRGCQEPCLCVTCKTSLLQTCSLFLFKPAVNVAAGHPLATSSIRPLWTADYFLLSCLRALWGTMESSCQFLHGPGECRLPHSALPSGWPTCGLGTECLGSANWHLDDRCVLVHSSRHPRGAAAGSLRI